MEYKAGNVIEVNGTYIEIGDDHLGTWQGSSGSYLDNQTVVYNDNLYQVKAGQGVMPEQPLLQMEQFGPALVIFLIQVIGMVLAC